MIDDDDTRDPLLRVLADEGIDPRLQRQLALCLSLYGRDHVIAALDAVLAELEPAPGAAGKLRRRVAARTWEQARELAPATFLNAWNREKNR